MDKTLTELMLSDQLADFSSVSSSRLTEGEKAAGQLEPWVERIQKAQRIVELGERLLAETVADARAVPPGGWFLTVGEGYGYAHTVVARPRSSGDRSRSRYSWEVIGWALGVSKQAAQQRFRRR